MSDKLTGGSNWARRLGRLALYAAIAALLAMVIAGPGYRFGFVPVMVGINLTMAAGALGALALVLGVAGAIASLRTPRQPALGSALLAILIGAALSFQLYGWYAKAKGVPQIHDITTDTADPPQFVAIAPLRADAPNPAAYAGEETAEKQRQAYPDLETLTVAAEPDEVIVAAAAVANEMGWDIVANTPQDGRLEATDTTFWFGFKDDVVVRARRLESRTEVDIRSKSRVGRSDLGTNAERIRTFADALKSRLGEG